MSLIPLLTALWLPVAAFVLFLAVLTRALLREPRKRLLLRASAVPILVLTAAPFLLMWALGPGGFLFLPRVIAATSLMTVLVLLGIFFAMDAGTRRDIADSAPHDLRIYRVPAFLSRGQDPVRRVSLARQISSPVRAVRNSAAMFGIILVIVLNDAFFGALLLSDSVSMASLTPEMVWSSLTNGTMARVGDEVHILSIGGTGAVYHCDDYSASVLEGFRISSQGIRVIAGRLCGLSEDVTALDTPTSMGAF